MRWDICYEQKSRQRRTNNRQKTYIYQQISMFFDICDLTMRTESPILLLSPSTKFDVNLFDDILLLPLEKYSFSQKILKFARKKKENSILGNVLQAFSAEKKERKILLCRMMRLNELTGIF